jgi:pimeloyl-ACP methyl ester carboxylesterase
MGPALPDEEIRALRADASSAALIDPLQRGAAPVDFSRIKSPALALWADPHSAADQYPYFLSLDSASRERLQASFTAQQSVRRTHLAEFREQIPHADIVLVPGGRHYVFLSHPRLVADAIRAFLARQRAQPN